MKDIFLEIDFRHSGDTVVGDYSLSTKLVVEMTKKGVYTPYGGNVKFETLQDFNRFLEYIQLFGHCIKTLPAFKKACKLADVSFAPSI